jgi:hypothetical protein
MKRFLFVLLFLIVSGFLCPENVKAFDEPWFTPKDNLRGNKVFYELFGGISYPYMVYSNSTYDNIKRNLVTLPDFGISARFQFKKVFSINPRISYSGQTISIADKSNYQLKSDNINLTIPFDFQFQLGERDQTGTTKLFFFAGPYIALPFSEKISTGTFSANLKMKDLTIPDYGVEAGFGFRIPTFSLEGRSFLSIRLSYFRGFADTYSLKESALNPLLNSRLYLDGGKRFNNGFKLILGIELPQKNKKVISFNAGGDSKKSYKRVVIIDEK